MLDTWRGVASSYNNVDKKGKVIWNVTQPGDPYDIRKSMIAKLPGANKNPMNNHLQIVCLMQAAEIERLSQFLDDMKLKFRENNRGILDRHSYEVQIKQLTQRVLQQQKFRHENEKLKQFVKQQSQQIENTQNRMRDFLGIDQKNKIYFQQSQERINQLQRQNTTLKSKIEDYYLQVKNIKAQMQAIERTKKQQIQNAYASFSVQSKQSVQNSIGQWRSQGEAQMSKMATQVQRLKILTESKEIQLNEANYRNQSLLRQLKSKGQSSQRKLRQYELRLNTLGDELSRLNINLREKITQGEEIAVSNVQLQRQISFYQQKLKQSQNKHFSQHNELQRLASIVNRYKSLDIQTQEMQLRLIKSEARIQQLIIQNDKLRFTVGHLQQLKIKNQQQSIIQIRNYEHSYGQLQRQKQSLISRLNIYQQDQASLHNRIKQNEGISYKSDINLSKTANLERNISSLNTQNQTLRTKLAQLYNQCNAYASQLTKAKNNYSIVQSQKNQLQGILGNTNNQVEFLRKQISLLKTNLGGNGQSIVDSNYQNEELRRLVQQKENDIANLMNQIQLANKAFKQYQKKISGQFTGDHAQNYASYEQGVNNLIKENQQLRKQLNEISSRSVILGHDLDKANTNMKLSVEQNQNLRQKFEKLQQLLTPLNKEHLKIVEKYNICQTQNEQLKVKLHNYHLSIEKYETQVQKRFGIYQESITSLARQNQIQKRQIQSKDKELNIFSNEIQNLQNGAGIVGQSMTHFQQERIQFKNQIASYQNIIAQLSQENNRKIQQYTNRNHVMVQQIDRLNHIISAKNQQIEYLQKNAYTSPLSPRSPIQKFASDSTQNQAINALSRQNQAIKARIIELQRTLVNYQHRFAVSAQQTQRLHQIIRSRQIQLQKITASLPTVASVAHSSQAQLIITKISQENQHLQAAVNSHLERLVNLEQQLKRKTQQIQHLSQTKVSSNVSSELVQFRQKSASDYQQKIKHLTNQNSQLIALKQEYQAKINFYAPQLEKMHALFDSKQLQIEAIKDQFETIRVKPLAQHAQNNQDMTKNYLAAKKHLQEYEKSIAKLYFQFDRLQKVINQLKKDRQILLKKNQVLSQEIARLINKNKELQGQGKEIRSKFVEENALEKQVAQRMALTVVLFAQIESLRKQLEDRQTEIQQIRKNNFSTYKIR